MSEEKKELPLGLSHLLDLEVLIKCSCDECSGLYSNDGKDPLKGGVGIYKLDKSNYFLFYDTNVARKEYTWMRIECDCPDPCECQHGDIVQFEEVFDNATGDSLLFHLDMFT